jgi:hypothetical protein
VDLIEQRVEPAVAALLGRAVELVLEGTDRITIPGLLAVLGEIPAHVISLFCWHSWALSPLQRR